MKDSKVPLAQKAWFGIFFVLIALLVAVLRPSPAYACSIPEGMPIYTLKDYVNASDLIFLGEVKSTSGYDPFNPDAENPQVYSAEVDVSNYYKGGGKTEIDIARFGVGALCLQEITTGSSYIFFATHNTNDHSIDYSAVYLNHFQAAIFPTQDNIDQVLNLIGKIDPDDILWSADMEEGDLSDWTFDASPNAGGGIFNTGGEEVIARASSTVARTGRYSAEATITNAYRAENGSRAIRLMRWTDKPWDQQGGYFPADAFFSTWMYIPTTYNVNKYDPWDPGDGGWWNVFQFKSDDENGDSQPIWVLNITHDDQSQELEFYLYSKTNSPASYGQAEPVPIPIGRWFHLEARYVQSASNNGRITFWQDGVQILDVENVVTILEGNAIWGIGNYTNHIVGGTVDGTATVYFDDAMVTSAPTRPTITNQSIFLPMIRH